MRVIDAGGNHTRWLLASAPRTLVGTLSPRAETTYAAAIPASDDSARRRCASFLAISPGNVG